MKKLFYSLMTLAAALTVSSCVKDIEGAGYDDASYVDASFAVNLGPQTKAFADGTKVNTLWTGIYETDDATNPTTFKWVADNWTPSPQQPFTFTSTGATAYFPGKIQLGKTYRVVFFAVYEAEGNADDDPLIGYQWHNTDNVLTGPSIEFVDYADALANDDKRDAFYGFYDTGVVSGSIDLTGSPIELKRPYAQVNVLVPNGNITDPSAITSSMTVTNAPTELNLATKATGNPKTWSFADSAIAEDAFGGYANTHKYVAMNYVLVDQAATGASYNVAFSVNAGGQTTGETPKSIANVPMKPNGRTNIVGNVFSEFFDISIPVVVNPDTDSDQVLTQITVTVGQTSDDAVPLTFSTGINPTWTSITLAINHPVTEDADMPTFAYDPEGVATAQFLSYDAGAGTVQIRVRPLVENGNTKITVTFPAVTKTEYSASTASFYVKVGDGVNQKILQDVEITTNPTKTAFVVGDKFTFDGVVTATFTNPASTEQILPENLEFCLTDTQATGLIPGTTTFDSALGDEGVVVSYTFNGKKLSDLYEITVTNTAPGPTQLVMSEVSCTDSGVNENSLNFSWTAVDHAQGYVVSIDGENFGETQTTLTYDLTNLEPGQAYTIYVKAIGDGTNYTDSAPKSATGTTKAAAPTTGSGTVDDPYTVAGVKAYIDNNGTDNVYVKGKISVIENGKQFSEGFGTAVFFISDDGTTTSDQFEAYSIYFLGNKSWVEGNTQIQVGDEVVLYGKVKKYNTTYETDSKNAYLYSLNGVQGLPEITLTNNTKGNNTAKTITVEWNTVSGATAFAVECGTQTYSAGANETSHTFTMTEYGTYAIKVTATAAGLEKSIVKGSVTLSDPSVPTTASVTFGSGGTKINGVNINFKDSADNSWNCTTVMEQTSFTQQPEYSQIGASSKPATSITFTTTFDSSVTISNFSMKFGGFASTAGSISVKVGDTEIASGSLNATNDVTVATANTFAGVSGTTLTITVTNIAKGVKVYNLSYTYK